MTEEMAQLIKDYVDARLREVLIGCIGVIERHDTLTMRADVRPLVQYTPTGAITPENFAVLGDIPVQFLFSGGYYIRPEYVRGDIVWVTFATYDITQALKGMNDSDESHPFSRENASVQFGLAKTGWVPPVDFSESGLLVGHKDGGSLLHCMESEIRMRATKVSVTGSLEVLGEISATGNIDSDMEITALKSSTMVTLSGHTHPYTDTPAGPAVTSPPTPGT